MGCGWAVLATEGAKLGDGCGFSLTGQVIHPWCLFDTWHWLHCSGASAGSCRVTHPGSHLFWVGLQRPRHVCCGCDNSHVWCRCKAAADHDCLSPCLVCQCDYGRRAAAPPLQAHQSTLHRRSCSMSGIAASQQVSTHDFAGDPLACLAGETSAAMFPPRLCIVPWSCCTKSSLPLCARTCPNPAQPLPTLLPLCCALTAGTPTRSG